jgi:hypothetical protein
MPLPLACTVVFTYSARQPYPSAEDYFQYPEHITSGEVSDPVGKIPIGPWSNAGRFVLSSLLHSGQAPLIEFDQQSVEKLLRAVQLAP